MNNFQSLPDQDPTSQRLLEIPIVAALRSEVLRVPLQHINIEQFYDHEGEFSPAEGRFDPDIFTLSHGTSKKWMSTSSLEILASLTWALNKTSKRPIVYFMGGTDFCRGDTVEEFAAAFNGHISSGKGNYAQKKNEFFSRFRDAFLQVCSNHGQVGMISCLQELPKASGFTLLI